MPIETHDVRPYPIEPPYVFAIDVPMGLTQDESGSASFGITGQVI